MNSKNSLLNTILVISLGILGFAKSGCAEEKPKPQPREGFIALFNGVDLSGWKGLVENPEKRAAMSAEELAVAQKAADQKMREHWKVVDGTLEFDGRGKNTTLNLCTASEYGDFELFIDWKILKAGDSGIYLRGSPQVQIWDTEFKDYWKIGADKGSGALYNNKKNGRSPLVKADKPVGEWNTFYIRMVGEKVTVKLNGQLVVDDTVVENFWARDKPIYARGAIELQNHSNLIWFRNIYLRELSGEAEASVPPDETELIGHWKLTADAKDSSAKGNHGISHGVQLGAQGAGFDGRKNYIDVKSSVSMETGSAPFSIAAWVRTDAELDDVLGDVISKFDPQSRRGFMLNIKHNVGATNSQANYRHVQFGIDNGRVDEKWTDHGRPGQAVLIFSMAVFDDELFVGICVAGKDQAGKVYRYGGDQKWVDCGSPDRSNAISALAVYDGKLYAGAAKYRLAGSSLAESENLNPGGAIYRYEGGRKWVKVGALPGREGVNGLVVYKGNLYASSMYKPAGFFRYEGGTEWSDCGVPDGKRVEQLSVYNGDLFATSYDGGLVFRYDGEMWTACGQLGDNTQTYAFAVNDGQLYVGTWPSGKVFRYAADDDWEDAGRLGGEKEVMGMAVYNGKMYGGTLPLAEVYRYDGGKAWKNMGQIDMTPDVKYRRAWTMAVYRGKMFVGTLPSGRVMSLKAGEVVTLDRQLPSGWVHLAAVKGKDRLKLYLNGKLAAASDKFDSSAYELSNKQPLKIGFGPHDYFNGSLSDVRFYRGELTDEVVKNLASQNKPGR